MGHPITSVTYITNGAHITVFHGGCTMDTVSVFTGVAEAPPAPWGSVFTGVPRRGVQRTRCGLTD